jgi:hypothetical protein
MCALLRSIKTHQSMSLPLPLNFDVGSPLTTGVVALESISIGVFGPCPFTVGCDEGPASGFMVCNMVVEVTARFERGVNVSQRAYFITRRSPPLYTSWVSLTIYIQRLGFDGAI